MLPVNTSPFSSPNPVSLSATRTSSRFERKFNVVIFGLTWVPKRDCSYSVCQSRVKNDHETAAAILNFLVSDIGSHSICDCFRLEKYSVDCNRPLLLRLTRPYEAVLVLSQSHELSKRPGIFIKLDFSPDERPIQSLLLKEPKKLIDSWAEWKTLNYLATPYL